MEQTVSGLTAPGRGECISRVEELQGIGGGATGQGGRVIG